LAKVDWLAALGLQIIIQKRVMADLVVGVVSDVLRHVAVKHQQAGNVGRSKPGDNLLAVLL
jgi:hypothetical protein